jgi:hypothetical protein
MDSSPTPAYRTQLTRVLADIDGIIAEACSHIEHPDHQEPDERVRAGMVLVDMV